MYDLFLSHILVLFLLYISSLRIFFLKEPKVDAAAVVSPFAFVVSILNFFIWGFTLQSLLVLIISSLFFLTNIRALLRVSEELLIDNFSIPFKIATFIELLILILVTFFVVYFRPVRVVPKDFGVEKRTLELNGTFSNGFTIQSEYQDKVKGKVAGKINVYTPREHIEWISSEDSIFNKLEIKTENEENKKISTQEAPLLLFVGTPFATVDNYEPYLLMLAQKGFTVLAADFFPADEKYFNDSRNSFSFRRFSFLKILVNNPDGFDALKKTMVLDYTKKGYEALSRIALVNFKNEDNSKKKIFYLTDDLDSDSIFSFSDKFDDDVVGTFQINFVPEYKTSSFGFPEQTDLILAMHLGIKRDKEFFIPRYLAFKTIQKIGTIKSK